MTSGMETSVGLAPIVSATTAALEKFNGTIMTKTNTLGDAPSSA